MAEGENARTPGADDRFQESSEALSQFVAHVLNQLSLSAWLPSAALMLALTFIFQLGAVLDSKTKPESPDVAIGRAFSAMAKTSPGGAILLFAAVIILTTLTQAFVFGAIRLLEGYWGTSRAMEWIAKLRCAHFQKKVQGLREHHNELTSEAWGKAQAKIGRQRIDSRSGDDAAVLVWTSDMLTYLGDHLQWGTSSVKLSRPDSIRALQRFGNKAPLLWAHSVHYGNTGRLAHRIYGAAHIQGMANHVPECLDAVIDPPKVRKITCVIRLCGKGSEEILALLVRDSMQRLLC